MKNEVKKALDGKRLQLKETFLQIAHELQALRAGDEDDYAINDALGVLSSIAGQVMERWPR